MERAVDAALDKRVGRLGRVYMRAILACVLVYLVVYGLVSPLELAADGPVLVVLVGHQRARLVHQLIDVGPEVLGGHAGDNAGALAPVTLNKGVDGLLVGPALPALDGAHTVAPAGLAADPRLIRLNRAGELEGAILGHRVPDAVAHEPRGLVGYAKLAVQLVGADTLLGRAHTGERIDPIGEGDGAVLEDGPDADGELLAAIPALAQTLFGGLPTEPHGVDAPAMNAHGAVGPSQALDHGAGFGLRQAA